MYHFARPNAVFLHGATTVFSSHALDRQDDDAAMRALREL